MPTYTISGRVVSTDGTPKSTISISVFERVDLLTDTLLVSGGTDTDGRYTVTWTTSGPPTTTWDLFVRAEDGSESVDSALVSDLDASANVDLILGAGPYRGLSEWDRVQAKIAPHLGSASPTEVPPDRLEWLARRADVYALHLGAYLQAHRLADQRSVSPETCYAFLRAGLPADLPSLLAIGEPAWESAMRDAWARATIPLPGQGTPADLDGRVQVEIDAMRELVVEAAVTPVSSATNQRALFDAAGLLETEQREFMTLWLGRSGSLSDFWQSVRDSATLGATKTEDFQFAIAASSTVGDHPSTLRGLALERGAGNISTTADLAAWTSADWDGFLVARVVEIPDWVQGSTPSERHQNYARGLARTLEDGHPTLFLRHALSRDGVSGSAPPNTEHLTTFLTQNPEFELTTTTIAHYLDQATDPWQGIAAPDQAQARTNLETLQRVYRLTPRLGRYDTAKALLDNGINAARDVAAMTRTEFIDEFAPLMPGEHHDSEALAGGVWDAASTIHASTLALVSYFGMATSGADFGPIKDVGDWAFDQAGGGLEGLSTILGNLDYCACTHCRSVFSPAAYLADLLSYLDDRPALSESSALKVLGLRRPDIEHILLDCANTNTVLPYIDLVNELLERKLKGQLGASSHQTTWASSELRLHPEHLDTSIYDGAELSERVYPWALPFSLPVLESRLYLEHLGVERHELMALLVDDDLPATPTPLQIVAEHFGMTALEGEIVAGTYTGNSSPDDREYWGVAPGAGTDGWVGALADDIPALMRAGVFSLEALQERLSLTFIDPSHYLPQGIEFQWAETCALEDATLLNLDAGALDRLHRFSRLERRSGIGARMLNVLVDDVGGGVLDAGFLDQLGNMQALHSRFALPWDELATWWATRIDARVYKTGTPALYQRRFLVPGNETPPPFQTTSERGDAILSAQSIAPGELPTVLAATRLSEADYDLIVASSLADDALSFSNLTRLFAIASFTRALELSVADFLALHSLSGTDPFSSPADALEFIAFVDAARRADLGIATLDWLLRGRGEPLVDDQTLSRSLAELARGLNTIESEVAQLVDSDGEGTRTNLDTSTFDIDLAMGIVDGNSALDETQQTTFVTANFSSFVDAPLAIATLVTAGGELQDVTERRTWVLRAFVGARRKRALLLDTVASTFEVSAAVAEALVFDILTIPAPGESDALGLTYASAFADESEIVAGIDFASHPDQTLGWRRLFKAAVLTRAHTLNADALRWYPGHLDLWLDLDSLPLQEGDPDASFSAWARLSAALNLRSMFQPGVLGHRDMAAAPSAHEALDILAEHTGWAADELKFIADKVGWSSVADFDDELALTRLRKIGDAGQRMGVGLDVLWSWVHAAPSLAKSSEIKAAARAKYGETQWPKVAAPLRDAIRTRQRDALVAAVLVSDPALHTREALYEHLLIDIEMSPCMLTSRIKQAISSVQTFVNRVFLRLESEDLVFKSDAVRLWDWMKSYRVWEANRKVFLYPENWLDPQLRKDKTPQFEALESALLQDRLDNDKVERALAGYLDAFDRISNLEINAIESRFDDLWVLGRTQSDPREWYLRTRLSGNQWQPWEQIPVQIDGDNVILVARDGRLLVFWLTTINTGVPGNGFEDSTGNAHELAISWTQRGEEGWGRTSVSVRSEAIHNPGGPKTRPYLLRCFKRDSEVRLIVYRYKEPNIKPIAEFRYDDRSRHVDYMGSSFNPEANAYIGQAGYLYNPAILGKQPNYAFDGQRFAKVKLDETPGGVDNFQYLDDDLPPSAESTSFVQGDLSALAFSRAPNAGYRSLLHQGDYWRPDPTKALLPVVYDDRQRKYLLQPFPSFANPGAADQGDGVSPAQLGAADTKAYFGCLEVDLFKTVQANPPQARAQKLRDAVVEVDVWPAGVPGVIPGLGQLSGISNLDAPLLLAPDLLANAQQTMGAGTLAVTPNDQVAPQQAGVSLSIIPLYHAHAGALVDALAKRGVDGLYRPSVYGELFRQQLDSDPMAFDVLDLNQEVLRGPSPRENFDFDWSSPHAIYNWELFFHIPMLLADKLSADQRWDESQTWFHTIFDPIEVVDLPGETETSQFWRLKPFHEQSQALAKDQFEAMLGIGVSQAEQQAAVEAFDDQVEVWRKNPFDPHAIARVRPGVYQRNLLMRYLDNLVDWADQLFRRDSIESVNEATVLYVLASQLLGPKPQAVPGPDEGGAEAKSYSQLAAGGLDALNNAAQLLENWVFTPISALKKLGCENEFPSQKWVSELVTLRFWYFCYPPNPELLKYWDIIADRLWKVRHCQNIEGIERQLSLFQPPIDPGLLVRATAAGVDLGSVLAELDSGLPPYRFRSVYGRADGFCRDLRSLGAALLQAIEKRDAEGLTRIRAEQELSLLEEIRAVRVRQVDEAKAAIASVRKAATLADHRQQRYSTLVDDGLSKGEKHALNLSLSAGIFRAASQAASAVAGLFHFVPDVTFSVGTDSSVKTTYGGTHLGAGFKAIADFLGIVPPALESAAGWISTNASYDRREEEWQHQQEQAELDIDRIAADLATAEIRLEITTRQLDTHDRQIEQSTSVELYLREKFSNRELYDWMVSQLSTLYFQTYQLAFDLAKRAERAYRHELAITGDDPVIKYGYWDSLHKGLLAGERLGHDLQRLDLAYMDRDEREFELSKSISLAQLSPAALRDLQETGECELELPEALFDLDHPGHYLRRIRGVRLTIPAVVGPYSSLGVRLELDRHKTRMENTVTDADDYPEQPLEADARFRYGYGGGEAIATSSAVADGGVFNLDFRDERYLPFEYSGVASRWKLRLPTEVRSFDYRTISDVIMSIDYTARDGGEGLRDAAEGALAAQLNALFQGHELTQLVVVQDAMPNEWEQFLSPAEDATKQSLSLPIKGEYFPYFAQRQGFDITQIEVAMLLDEGVENPASETFTLSLGASQAQVQLNKVSSAAYMAGDSGVLQQTEQPGTWTLTRDKGPNPQPGDLDHPDGWLDRSKVVGMLIAIRYTLVP